MKILLTNDDGIEADGILAFADALRSQPDVDRVLVVAPTNGCSCCSHSVNTAEEFAISQISDDSFMVDSWPADCVRIGLLYLAFKPDWVLSGINHGGNLGVDIAMSGTCSAAREAAWLGFRSAAFSQYRKPQVSVSWPVSARRAVETFRAIHSIPTDTRGFWNVNLPAIEDHFQLPQPVFCDPDPSSLEFHYEPIKKTEETSETVLYRGNYQQRPRIEGCDVEACFGGRPSISFCKA